MSKEYQSRISEITVVDGVEVDIEVRGDERRAETVLMDLKDRLGWVAEAYEQETPPSELDECTSVNTPPIRVSWERVFAEDNDE
jgi:hypothetical protein